MSTVTRERSIAAEDLPPPDDPFFYGWRDVRRTRPDGSEYLEQVPLSRWDTLHPEEGDHIVESSLNDLIRDYLADVFRARLANVPETLVLSNTGVYWDHPDLEHHAPDVCAIFGVKEKRTCWESFSVAEQGVRPRVIVEIVSPNVRKNDVKTKFEEYHLAEVPCYVIIDRERTGRPWILKGYVYTPSEFLPMPVDSRGRLWLADLKIWLAVDGERVICYDGATGNEIGDYTAITRRLEQEEARAEQEKARAEQEKTRADAAVTARQTDEARIRELEAEVARLRTPPPSA